jgi:2-polyprenyl-6-hydroxyphenyl methylase/3-demethylubiquinone-9 3-methyltransferase
MIWGLLPFSIQGLIIIIDEFYFHRLRELPKWEKIGHPLDTLTLVFCFAWAAFVPYSSQSQGWFLGLSIFSCLFITKDEWVHAKECSGGELWTHAVLFLIHPLVLFGVWKVWSGPEQNHWILQIQTALLFVYGVYQILYWNFFHQKSNVNNVYYNDLGERWYKAQDDPIALLRAESKLFVEWIDVELRKKFSPSMSRILDIGCGGGLVSNALAARGWNITGVDLSQESLDVARKYDSTGKVNYMFMDAETLSFPNGQFDAVISLDMLEHVEQPEKVILECSRVLKPEGLFFFHTFNRTFKAWLFAVKGLEWLIKNTPDHIHVLRLFIKPKELESYCRKANMDTIFLTGVEPIVNWRTWKPLLLEGIIHKDFQFQFTSNTKVGYAGIAKKTA